MYAGVSGLLANARALEAISNNIANANTPGYKRQSTSFSSLVSGGGGAGGLSAKTHQYVTQPGIAMSTSSSTDLSVAGAGFFVTTTKAEGLTPADSRLFTRTGSFMPDSQGYLRNDWGLYLQGWLADPVTGVINADPSDLSRLSSINISGLGGTTDKTTRVGLSANLNAGQAVSPAARASVTKPGLPETPSGTADYDVAYSPTGKGDEYTVEIKRNGVAVSSGVASYDPTTGILIGYVPKGTTTPVASLTTGGQTVQLSDLGLGDKTDAAASGAYDPASRSMSDYAKDPSTGVKPDFELQIPVSDSQGGARSLTLSLIKGPGPNEWFAELRAKPGELANNANGLISSGKLTFTNDGKLLDTGGLLSGDPPSVSIGGSDPSATGSGARWADGLGIAAQTIKVDLNRAPGGLTQYSSQSVAQPVEADGAAFGKVTGVEIDEHGYVTASFDNGSTRRIAQVALATFANPNGLQAANGNAFLLTNDSGGYNLKAPGEGGAGGIASSTLEASTVDLAVEFTDLVRVQRAYSACSRIIKVADEMLVELLDMKR
jgi:flagellar hook protein FlgE